jgi:hypothetical protein
VFTHQRAHSADLKKQDSDVYNTQRACKTLQITVFILKWAFERDQREITCQRRLEVTPHLGHAEDIVREIKEYSLPPITAKLSRGLSHAHTHTPTHTHTHTHTHTPGPQAATRTHHHLACTPPPSIAIPTSWRVAECQPNKDQHTQSPRRPPHVRECLSDPDPDPRTRARNQIRTPRSQSQRDRRCALADLILCPASLSRPKTPLQLSLSPVVQL